MEIVPFQQLHLPQLQALINAQLSALVPGWSLSEAYIADKLVRDPGEYITDPWVVARHTLCALEQQRLVAAVHLLRYADQPAISSYYQNAGEIYWLVAWPNASQATDLLLAAAQQQLRSWAVRTAWFNGGILVGPFVGVPDVWPHIAASLGRAGFGIEDDYQEAVYGGVLVPATVGAAPLAGLSVKRTSGQWGARLTALLAGELVGMCECIPDLTEGGALPALCGWAELTELEVAEAWRNQGIGTWLLGHAVEWLVLGGCTRIVFAVSSDSEAAGVDRFYKRFGWQVFVREQKGWHWQPDLVSQAKE